MIFRARSGARFILVNQVSYATIEAYITYIRVVHESREWG